MAIPDVNQLLGPTLAAIAKEEVATRQLVPLLADQFGLSETERETLQSSTGKTVLATRVHWALANLTKAGAIQSVRTGSYIATDRGREILKSGPAVIDIGYLGRLAASVGLPNEDAVRLAPGAVTSLAASATATAPPSAAAPIEQMESAYRLYRRDVEDQLLQRVRKVSPSKFERLVVELLEKLGYGDKRPGASQHLGRGGDGGLDGVIRLDALGLDEVYVQAKRYQADNAITPEQIRGFAGALDGKGARKGVFITSSRFTRDAVEFAERHQQKRIVLIDGERLAALMFEHGLGLIGRPSFPVWTINDADFDPDVAL